MKLAGFLVRLQRQIVLGLCVTSVSDVTQHSRHANLVAADLESVQAPSEVIDGLSVVSLHRSDEADAAQRRRCSRFARQLLRNGETLEISLERRRVITSCSMNVTDILQTRGDAGLIV